MTKTNIKWGNVRKIFLESGIIFLLNKKHMSYPLFRAKAGDGIVVARRINFIRKPEENLYGVSDRDIYERGLLNFNFHPDQWGGIIHSYGGFPGTKVTGLPVMLMDNLASAEAMISEGGVAPVSQFRSDKNGKDDGAILLTTFTVDQVHKMGIGINVPFDEGKRYYDKQRGR